jgi:hypothetical protein
MCPARHFQVSVTGSQDTLPELATESSSAIRTDPDIPFDLSPVAITATGLFLCILLQ